MTQHGQEAAGRNDTSAELDRIVAAIEESDQPVDDPTDSLAIPGASRAQGMLLSESYKGVFPHPTSLRDFDSVVNNGAERAFSLTEREQSHRHELDHKIMDLEFERERAQIEFQRSHTANARIALVATIALVALLVAASTVLAFFGHQLGASVLGIAGVLAGLGGTYVARKKKSQVDP